MSEWRKTTLGDVSVKIGSGATPTGGSNAYKETGISLIRSQNISDFQFSYSGLAFIDEDQANELKNVTVEKNDVLLNITGDSVARCCVVPKSVLPARVNQHVAIIRLNPRKATHSFIFYLLQAKKDELLMHSEIGATRKALTKGMIEGFGIILPPLPEQKAIAAVLSSLDDKIDLLHRQNATLEAMAATLFRQWFVEEVQDDWVDGCLGDIAYFLNGKARPSDTTEGNIPIYGGNGILGYSVKSNYDGATIIIGRVGAYCGSIFIEHKPVWVSDNALVAKPVKTEYSSYLFFLLKFLNLNEMAEGSSHPLLTQTLLKSIPIKLATTELIGKFVIQADSWLHRIKCNSIQIRTLEKLRDTLLPKLMSGEVRVKVEVNDHE